MEIEASGTGWGRRRVTATRGAAAAALAWLAACGASAPTEAETSAAFARMQVGEARLATASHVAGDPERDCASRAHAADDACDAAGGVCAEAAPLSDADAGARCERARDACEDARGSARRGCPRAAGSEAE